MNIGRMKLRTIIVCAMLVGCKESPQKTEAKPTQPDRSIENAIFGRPKALYSAFAYDPTDKRSSVYVFYTENIMSQWSNASKKDDVERAVDRVEAQESAYRIEPGTKIDIIESKPLGFSVIVIGGEKDGKRGWICKEHVNKEPLPPPPARPPQADDDTFVPTETNDYPATDGSLGISYDVDFREGLTFIFPSEAQLDLYLSNMKNEKDQSTVLRSAINLGENAQVKRISLRGKKMRVEVMTGEAKGKTGWLPSRWVHIK